MASTSPVLLRLISSSIAIANHAGNIIRDVMAKGELGIVQKVFINELWIILTGSIKFHLLLPGSK